MGKKQTEHKMKKVNEQEMMLSLKNFLKKWEEEHPAGAELPLDELQRLRRRRSPFGTWKEVCEKANLRLARYDYEDSSAFTAMMTESVINHGGHIKRYEIKDGGDFWKFVGFCYDTFHSAAGEILSDEKIKEEEKERYLVFSKEYRCIALFRRYTESLRCVALASCQNIKNMRPHIFARVVLDEIPNAMGEGKYNDLTQFFKTNHEAIILSAPAQS